MTKKLHNRQVDSELCDPTYCGKATTGRRDYTRRKVNCENEICEPMFCGGGSVTHKALFKARSGNKMANETKWRCPDRIGTQKKMIRSV